MSTSPTTSPFRDWWESTVASITRDHGSINDPDEVLCAGIVGDHNACSTQANVYYLANPKEICGLGNDYSTEDLLVTPREWFELYRPCWTWGTDPATGLPRHIISQLFSTIWVMAVAVFCMWIAFKLWRAWRQRDSGKGGLYHLSRLLWASSMFMWGGGAFLAGLSYEVLEWHLKCTKPGDSYCLAYSWMEIVYVMLQCAACCSLLVAVSFSSSVTTGYWFLISWLFATFDFLVYCCCVAVGAFEGNAFLLSFEFCCLMGAFPMIIAVLINVGSYLYLKHLSNDPLDYKEEAMGFQLSLLYSWIVMGITGVAYEAYLASGIQYMLWCEYHLWFTANDVLHIGMIFWAYRIYKLMDDIKDSLHIRNALSDVLSMSKDDAMTDFGTFPTA